MLVSRALGLRARTRRSQLWALRDVDLEVEPGRVPSASSAATGRASRRCCDCSPGVTAPTEGRSRSGAGSRR